MQADLDLDLTEGLGSHPADYTPGHLLSRDVSTSTVSIQGSGNHYHACAQDGCSDVGFDPSILPPPDPWMDTGTEEERGRDRAGTMCPHDGRWFLKLLQAEEERMEGRCQQMEKNVHEKELPDESE